MRRNKSRKSAPTNTNDMLKRLGDKLRIEYGEMRYVDYLEFRGGQWTRRAGWERLTDGGEWKAIDLPLENY